MSTQKSPVFREAILVLFAVTLGLAAVIWLTGLFWWIGICLIALAVLLSIRIQFLSAGNALVDAKSGSAKLGSAKGTLVQSWGQTLVATALLGTGLFVVCILIGMLHLQSLPTILDKRIDHWMLIKLPTVLVQQMLLLFVLVPSLLVVTRSKFFSCSIAAFWFAACHLPNPMLVGLTLLASVVWICLYFKFGRVIPLVVSHFCLAVLAASFCGEYIMNMRVGPTCLELWPQQHGDKPKISVMPKCIVGELDTLKYVEGKLVLKGWAVDLIHNQVPDQILVLHPEQGATVLENKTEDLVERLDKMEYIERNALSRCGFAFAVDPECVQFRSRVNIYARNANGWFGQLKVAGSFLMPDHWPSQKSLAFFPKGGDGFYQLRKHQGDEVEVFGWAIDTESKTVCPEIYILDENTLAKIDLIEARTPRKDIAQSYRNDRYLNCGFRTRIDQPAVEELRFFAAKKSGELFELKRWEK